MTIGQLEQILDTLKGKSDSSTARELSGLELTERASSMRLIQWDRKFPGSRAREALILLADASAFLDLPAEDIPNIPAPNYAAQQAILKKGLAYMRDTITKLPNFYTTRATKHFDDSPHRVQVKDSYDIIQGGKMVADDRNAQDMIGDKSWDRPLYFADRSSMVVTYRDGAEVTQSQTGNKRTSEYLRSHWQPGVSLARFSRSFSRTLREAV